MVAKTPACVWRIGWLSVACALLENCRVSSQSDDGYWPDFFRNPVDNETLPPISEAGLPDEDYFMDYTQTQDATTCNGHGTTVDANGTCTCIVDAQGTASKCSSKFFANGFLGHGGSYCQLEIESTTSAGGLVKEVLNASLEYNHMRCHTVCWGESPWEYLAVQLTRESDQGDPDLFGMLYFNGMNHIFPEDHGGNFDFEETSGSNRKTVQQIVKKEDIPKAEQPYSGVGICVHAYGLDSIQYTLRWELGQCPVRFTQSGKPLQCSSDMDPSGSSVLRGTCDRGSCRCAEKYRAPTEGAPSNVGFEDCSAEVGQFSGEKGIDTTVIMPDTWKFYSFEVLTSDNQVVFDLMPHNLELGGHPRLFIRHGQPPANGYNQHDRSTEDYSWAPDTMFKTQQIILDRSEAHFRDGAWYAGVYAADGVEANYTLVFNKYRCPMACSGHGTCEESSSLRELPKCNCLQGFFKDDCSAESKELDFDVSREDVLEYSAYAYFTLPYISQEVAQRNVELEVQADFHFKTYWMSGFWMESDPVLLLKRGGVNDYPSADEAGYDFRQVLKSQNHTYTMTVPSSFLNEGHWKIAMYNPTRLDTIEFSIVARLRAYCPNKCTSPDQGTCNADGSCTCRNGYSGADCGFKANACQVNTFRSETVHIGTETITCQHPCVAGDYVDHCEWCESPYRLFKKVPNPSHACIKDACTENKIVHKPEIHAHCEVECLRPMDGTVRTLALNCMEGAQLRCDSMYELAEDRQQCIPFHTNESTGDRNTGVAVWAVVLLAFAMVIVGIGLGLAGMYAYRKWAENHFGRSQAIWHDLDDEFTAARF